MDVLTAPGPDGGLFGALQRIDRLLIDAVARVSTAALSVQELVRQLADDHVRGEVSRLTSVDEGSPLLPVQRLQRVFRLTSFERDVVLVALAAEIDDRYGRIFALLDGVREPRRPTVGLVLRLFGHLIEGAYVSALAALGPTCKLYLLGLIEFVGDGPHAERALRIPSSMWPRLVGQLAPGPFEVTPCRAGVLDDLVLASATRAWIADVATWAVRRPPSQVMLAVTGPPGSGRDGVAAAMASLLGRAALRVDGAALSDTVAVRAVIREVLWHDAVVVLHGTVTAVELAPVLRDLPAPVIAIVDDRTARELAASCHRSLLEISLSAFDTADREQLWARALAGHSLDGDLDARALAARFQLGPGRIAVAVAMAAAAGEVRGHAKISADALRAACRSGDTRSSLARRLDVPHDLGDLVVPTRTRGELDLLLLWARHGASVFHLGAAGSRLARRQGLVSLFTGPPGTGKTMAAQIIARTLDRDLLRVDLSQVVDKYIGETEKHLDRVFADADIDGAILFFDEADALFAKRTIIADSHDRHANLETAFLLQRLEAHRGIVVLASNLEKNLDAAFLRRIHIVAEFPMPGAEERLEIWRRQIDAAHLASDVDLELVASRFAIAGGDIRNAAVTAVLLATRDDGRVAMRHVVLGVWRELRKAGRMASPSDFGAWQGIVLEHVRAGC